MGKRSNHFYAALYKNQDCGVVEIHCILKIDHSCPFGQLALRPIFIPSRSASKLVE
jgi:hypothetical protein